MDSLEKKYEYFESRIKLAEEGSGPNRIRKQHDAGKKTARERVAELLDPGSFNEFDKLVVHLSLIHIYICPRIWGQNYVRL